MTTTKRLRGRPRGSGKDDTVALTQVADLLVHAPLMKPTTVMKRVMRSRKDRSETDATLLRRWQVKWKQERESLLAAARERAKPRPLPPVQDVVAGIMTLQSQIERAMRTPEFLSTVERMIALSDRINQATRTPKFLRGLDRALALYRQFEQAVCNPGFHVVANAAAFQQQIGHARLLHRRSN